MRPSAINAGDKIGIVSTARKISLAEIQAAIEIINKWGLEVVIGKTIGAEHFQFAGDDEVRKEDLQNMLDDNSIKAILFARGGYGTVRIIDDIDWRKFLKKPKWLCGFSDITVIHSHLLSVYNIPSVYSIMGINFSTATFESIESLRKILFREKLSYEISAHDFNRRGEGKGILCGGNLSLLYSLNGTPSDVDTTGKILFMEDIDEHLYHVDRMMMTLKRSGKLENLAGLIVGHFTDMKNKDESNPFGKTAYEIIAEHVNEFDFPVCFGFPAGHEPDNRALVIGEEWKLEVGEKVKLVQT
ncbi:MAG TPA: LD-carboxypeptidase [Chitinophagales bacterium]|nr:LD-carboxypeptidase [Chitinophagales bacterium]